MLLNTAWLFASMREGVRAAVAVCVLWSASANAIEQSAQRGMYLARAGNCISCHTTLDGKPYAGGVVFPTAFGSIYSSNITSDPKVGIGAWTLVEFTVAMRQGVRPSGEHLYPAFPYTAFTKLSDADIADLFAYLKTVPGVNKAPPKNDMMFPFGQRRLMAAWNAFFFEEGRFKADPSKSPQWNRGAYLIESLEHCSACHSPRNLLGAEKSAEYAFTGGKYFDVDDDERLVERASANLTSAKNGLAAWSTQDVADYLKTGACSRTRVTGAMNAVVLNSTRHLSAADVTAMATFLKALPQARSSSGAVPDANVVKAGALQFDIHCGTCHLPTGLGSPKTAPPLVGSAIALTANPASLINLVLYAPRLPVEAPSDEWLGKSWQQMPAFDQRLTDEDAAALLTYVRNAWGNAAPAVSADDVARQR